MLISMKANIEDKGVKGDCTPLMEAANAGYVDIVQLLIANGADVNAKSTAGLMLVKKTTNFERLVLVWFMQIVRSKNLKSLIIVAHLFCANFVMLTVRYKSSQLVSFVYTQCPNKKTLEHRQ